MSISTEKYTPSQTKRFEISPDQYSRSRLDALVETTRELQTSTPLIGIALWGSLSKGKQLTPENLSMSDIELTAFYDRNVVERTGGNKYENLAGDIREGLQSGVLTRLQDAGDKPEMNIAVRGLALEGEYSMFTRVMDLVTGNFQDASEMNQLLSTVSAFFGLNPGGGLKPYRVRFFEDIANTIPEEKTDKLWQFISENVIKIVERGVHGTSHANIPPQIERFYPATFDQAARFYANK